jgi:16S rRNA (cytosine1402-N4)-methyltransferase
MHTTVLLKECVDGLNIRKGATVVDGTLGGGGHVELMCENFGRNIKVIALDLDTDAIDRARTRLAGLDCDIEYRESNFRDIDKVLGEMKVAKVDGILLDLGFSNDQLESSGRGISFRNDEPLKMTLKKSIGPNEFDAGDIVNRWQEEDIANVIYGYGEERFARRIAREIVETRENEGDIKTTHQLVKIIESAVPSAYKRGRIHPATKTFQALRIAVNSELENLRIVLDKGFEALRPSGRLAVISFHSLEDRIVKNFMRDRDREEVGRVLYKKPITPSPEELKANPKSRSAKLRIIEKI